MKTLAEQGLPELRKRLSRVRELLLEREPLLMYEMEAVQIAIKAKESGVPSLYAEADDWPKALRLCLANRMSWMTYAQIAEDLVEGGFLKKKEGSTNVTNMMTRHHAWMRPKKPKVQTLIVRGDRFGLPEWEGRDDIPDL